MLNPHDEWVADEMSMCGCLRRLNKEELAQLQLNPNLISRLIDTEDEEFQAGPWPNGPVLDLDTSWHVLHFLITGDPRKGEHPLGNAIMGGKGIGPDIGYGPARLIQPAEVRTIAKALAEVDENQLRERFDPVALEAAKVYSPLWSLKTPVRQKRGLLGRLFKGRTEQHPRDHTMMLAEYLTTVVESFRSLVDFYEDAASRGDAMLLWIE